MLTCKVMENGFEYLEVANKAATARIALQGAHLYHYVRRTETPLLWVSGCSRFENGTAIRGGIPVCWPWFGMHDNPELPQHGFARTSLWTLESHSDITSEQSETVLLLRSCDASRQLWPFEFELRLRVRVGIALEVTLETLNTGTQPMPLSDALHTYFPVSSIENVHLEGLQNKPYFDNLDKGIYHQHEALLSFGAETDRVYQEVIWPLRIADTMRTITIDAQNSSCAVVWNPWIEKCAQMSGMCQESYKTMLCVETANAREDARVIAPGALHVLSTTIS